MSGDRNAFEYWVGMDTHDIGTSDLARFNSFYSSTHVPEVMGEYPGMVGCERFELVEQDDRGPFGPRWLTRYAMTSEGARHYAEVNSDPNFRMPFTEFPSSVLISIRWRFLWQSLSSQGSPRMSCDEIRLIGMDPALGSSESESAEFNQFYDRTHVGEAREILGSNYAIRLRLAHDFVGSDNAPEYAALYEIDKSRVPADTAGRSAGPRSWEGRNTHWRLTYSLIDRVTRTS